MLKWQTYWGHINQPSCDPQEMTEIVTAILVPISSSFPSQGVLQFYFGVALNRIIMREGQKTSNSSSNFQSRITAAGFFVSADSFGCWKAARLTSLALFCVHCTEYFVGTAGVSHLKRYDRNLRKNTGIKMGKKKKKGVCHWKYKHWQSDKIMDIYELVRTMRGLNQIPLEQWIKFILTS